MGTCSYLPSFAAIHTQSAKTTLGLHSSGDEAAKPPLSWGCKAILSVNLKHLLFFEVFKLHFVSFSEPFWMLFVAFELSDPSVGARGPGAPRKWTENVCPFTAIPDLPSSHQASLRHRSGIGRASAKQPKCSIGVVLMRDPLK